tara:strand:- start:124 stop:600 length:477 start_codon:yes stop_codon:yes gene_type:complete
MTRRVFTKRFAIIFVGTDGNWCADLLDPNTGDIYNHIKAPPHIIKFKLKHLEIVMQAERDTPDHARYLELELEKINTFLMGEFDSPCIWILDRGSLFLMSRDGKTRIDKATVHADGKYLIQRGTWWSKRDHSIGNVCVSGCAACAAGSPDDRPAKSLK